MSDLEQSILHDLILPPPPANIGKRIAAALIDGVILVLIFIAMGRLFGDHYEKTTVTTTVASTTTSVPGTTNRVVETSSGYQLTGWASFGFMLCWFLVMPFMEGKTGGTVGKKLLRIKVVRQDGRSSTVGTSLVRHLFDCIDCFFLIGLIVALTNVNRMRIGDMVAHTCVVDKNLLS
jgi:uncharacterized RDD family membrane protein YckC